MIDSLELGEYHDVCYWNLSHRQTFPVSVQAELHLGAVVYSPSGSELDGLDEIAFLPDANPDIGSWYGVEADRDTMKDGWTRCIFHSCLNLSLANQVECGSYNSAQIFRHTISSRIYLEYDDHLAWLSQANHIFHRLQIKSNYKDYGVSQ